MLIIVSRALHGLRARVHGWRAALALALFVFCSSWLLMALVEPASNPIAAPSTFWWWFLVTSATVGYGDTFPVSGGGRAVGAYVIVGGIVALTILFTELAGHLQAVKGRRMKGVIPLEEAGHLVLLGYTPGRTERIVRELLTEERSRLVLCAWEEECAEHPMPQEERVAFVRGDLGDAGVLERACVPAAGTVVIDARDDNEALALAVAVDHVGPSVHLVAALRDMSRHERMRYVNPGVQCVQWHMPNLLCEEALDHGITEVYTELMNSSGRSNTYSVRLPEALAGASFGEVQTVLGRDHGATVIAVRHSGGIVVGPGWDLTVEAGALLYYLAGARIPEPRAARGPKGGAQASPR